MVYINTFRHKKQESFDLECLYEKKKEYQQYILVFNQNTKSKIHLDTHMKNQYIMNETNSNNNI